MKQKSLCHQLLSLRPNTDTFGHPLLEGGPQSIIPNQLRECLGRKGSKLPYRFIGPILSAQKKSLCSNIAKGLPVNILFRFDDIPPSLRSKHALSCEVHQSVGLPGNSKQQLFLARRSLMGQQTSNIVHSIGTSTRTCRQKLFMKSNSYKPKTEAAEVLNIGMYASMERADVQKRMHKPSEHGEELVAIGHKPIKNTTMHMIIGEHTHRQTKIKNELELLLI